MELQWVCFVPFGCVAFACYRYVIVFAMCCICFLVIDVIVFAMCCVCFLVIDVIMFAMCCICFLCVVFACCRYVIVFVGVL